MLEIDGKIITAERVTNPEKKAVNKKLQQLALAYKELIKNKPSINTNTIPKSKKLEQTTNKNKTQTQKSSSTITTQTGK